MQRTPHDLGSMVPKSATPALVSRPWIGSWRHKSTCAKSYGDSNPTVDFNPTDHSILLPIDHQSGGVHTANGGAPPKDSHVPPKRAIRGGGPSMAQYCLGNTLDRPTKRIETRVRPGVPHCRTRRGASRTAARSAAGRSCRRSSLQPLGASHSVRSALRAPAARSADPACPVVPPGGRLPAAGCLVPPRRRPARLPPAATSCLVACLVACLNACLVVCLAACLVLLCLSRPAAWLLLQTAVLLDCLWLWLVSIERSKVAHEYLFDYACEYLIMRV
jgi:hypothetical protein